MGSFVARVFGVERNCVMASRAAPDKRIGSLGLDVADLIAGVVADLVARIVADLVARRR